MPSFTFTSPEGKSYTVNGPEGATQEQAWGILQNQLGGVQQPTQKPEDVGILSGTGAAFKRGLSSFGDIGAGYGLAGSALAGNPQETFDKMQAMKAAQAQPTEKPALTFSDLQRIYEEKGLGSALAQAPKYIAEQAAESAPQMAVPLAAGEAATVLAAPLGPAAPLVGLAAGIGTYGLQQFGSLMQRQGQTAQAPDEISVGKAATAAAIQAPLGYIADRFTLGIGGLGEKGVLEAGKELAKRKALGEIGTLGVIGGVGKQAIKGAAEGFIAEAPTEALEQVLERWQAGLPLTGDDAYNEYKEAFMGAGAIGAVGGGGSRGMEARKGYKAPIENATPEVKTAPNATPAPEQAPMLALPAPQEKVEPTPEEPHPLVNPLGNFTEAELGQEVTQFVNNLRKEEGKPKLESHSIEDLVDAGAPDQEINRLLAYKTNYDPSVQLVPTNVTQIAEDRNIDTGTKGFTDFLRRTTGAEDLNTMSQPQLYAAAQALTNLERSETPIILPEGTNATRFTQKQYKKALEGLDFVMTEHQAPSLGRTSVIQEVKDFSGLTNDHDVEALINTAIRNGDLSESIKPRYEVVDDKGNIAISTLTRQSADRYAKNNGLNVREGTYKEIAFPGAATVLPGGPDIRVETFKQSTEPVAHDIMAGKRVLKTVKEADQAQRVTDALEKARQAEIARINQQIKAKESAIAKNEAHITRQEAVGQGHPVAQAALIADLNAKNKAIQSAIDVHSQEISQLSQPVSIVPRGERPITRQGFTYYENNQPVSTFPTQEAAEAYALSQLDAPTLSQIITAAPEQKGLMPKRLAEMARQEFATRRGGGEKGIRIGTGELAGAEERLAKLGIYSAQLRNNLETLKNTLLPTLHRFGLDKVGLRIVNSIEDGRADATYVQNLITVALDTKNPVGALRHESIHALRELGAFRPEEWKALSNKAKSEWIEQYIKKPNLYDSYKEQYQAEHGSLKGFEDYIQEEAVAEAFKHFSPKNPPAGMIGNILFRLGKFFEALKNVLNGMGFNTSENIFGKIEEGKLAPTQGVTNAKEKRSLRKYTPEGLPESKARPSDRGTEGITGRGDRGRGKEVRSLEALTGAPIIEGATGPDPRLVSVAERYAKANGIPYERQKSYVTLDEDRAKRIAQAYEDMANEPNNPKVKAAYKDMMRQLRNQYDALVDDGYEFTFFDSNTDPYDGNPWNAMRDLRKNKHMAVYGTYDGFGTEGITTLDSRENPLLAKTGLNWKDQNGVEHPVVANDLFRAVHDAFGHGLEGAGFRAQGEENAWQAHAKLFTGPALGALTTETRGQNSWLNYGKYGEKNKTAKVEDTIFAPQKIGLMPEWTWEEGAEAPKGIVLGKKQPDAQTYEGIHYSTAERTSLNGKNFGNGLKGAESKRLADATDPRIKNRVYFYIPHELTGKNIPKEAGLGMHAHKQTFSNILAPGNEMKRLNAEAGGNANDFESAVIDAGYDGYAVPSMGMMVILNKTNVPVKYRGTQAEMKVRGEKYSIRPPETKEFKQWFGDSKVVDSDGNPLLVYHASTNFDGNEFKPSKKVNRSGNPDGYYFTHDIEDANNYAGEEEGSEIIPAFLSIKKPYSYGQNTYHSQAMIDQFEKEIRSQFDLDRLGESWYNEKLNVFKEGRFPNISFPTDAMTRIIQAGGYDGMKDGRDWVAFKPNQIKSAFNQKPTAGKDIRYSIRQDIDPSIQERIGSTTVTRQEKGFVERLMEAISPTAMARIRQAMVNKYEGIERQTRAVAEEFGKHELLAENSAIAAALQSDRAAGIAAASFTDGIPVLDKGYTHVTNKDGTVKGLIPVLEPLMKYKDPYIFQAFQYYAGTRRGKRLLADGREQLFTADDIAKGDALAKQFPEFKEVFNEYQKYNQGLVNYMKDTGVISEQEAKIWTQNWDYIPFYRQMEGEATAGPKVFSAIAGVAKPKKLKGGTTEITDFMETVVRNARAAIEAGMKNEAARRVIRDSLKLELAEEVPIGATGSDIVTVKENGLTKHYRVADPLLVESMKGLNLPQMQFLSWLAAPANILRNFVTKDPGFMLANLGRDSLQAWITSGTDMKPIIDTFKQFGKTLTNSSPEAQALALAGLTGYDFSGDVKSSAKNVEKELRKRAGMKTPLEKLTTFWDMLEHGSHASDMATRAEVYKRTLERTGSEAEAFYQSMEVLNFSRKGNSAIIRVLSAMVPFFNARVQGLDVLYRSGWGKMATENSDVMKKAFASRALTMMGMSMLYWFLVSDTDEYKKLGKEERDNYWIVPALEVNGKPFRFPIPFELGVIFKVLPERVLEASFGNDTAKDLKESIGRNIASNLSFNPIPQAFVPIVENTANYSFFTGDPIVGRGMEDLAPKYQVGAGTSLLAQKVGDQLNVSPLKVDNIIRGYTGTMGTYAVQALDAIFRGEGDPVKASLRMEQLPVIKRFFSGDSGTVSAYYDMKNDVTEVVRTVNMLERTGRVEELREYLKENGKLYAMKDYVSTLDKDMKQLREARTLIMASKDYSGDEKQARLNEIHQMEVHLTERIKEIRKHV